MAKTPRPKRSGARPAKPTFDFTKMGMELNAEMDHFLKEWAMDHQVARTKADAPKVSKIHFIKYFKAKRAQRRTDRLRARAESFRLALERKLPSGGTQVKSLENWLSDNATTYRNNVQTALNALQAADAGNHITWENRNHYMEQFKTAVEKAREAYHKERQNILIDAEKAAKIKRSKWARKFSH